MDFAKRLALAAAEIPYGKVVSYGRLAFLCGRPAAARQVGAVLSRGLLPEGVPAHRIVNSRGVLSGAAAFDVPGGQQALLEAEGVAFLDKNRVNLKGCAWKTGPADMARLAGLFELADV